MILPGLMSAHFLRMTKPQARREVVLVALAIIGEVPKNNNTGNVSRVPPPATALIAPAAAPANINETISSQDMPG